METQWFERDDPPEAGERYVAYDTGKDGDQTVYLLLEKGADGTISVLDTLIL